MSDHVSQVWRIKREKLVIEKNNNHNLVADVRYFFVWLIIYVTTLMWIEMFIYIFIYRFSRNISTKTYISRKYRKNTSSTHWGDLLNNGGHNYYIKKNLHIHDLSTKVLINMWRWNPFWLWTNHLVRNNTNSFPYQN